MPLPFFIVIGAIAIVGVVAIGGSVSTAFIKHNKKAKKKLKSRPNGILRPPPGMNRNELRRAAQEKLQMNITEYYNFAFCGGTNAGKSTLINALLNREDVRSVEGRAHNMFGSAPIGEWQTTMNTLCYAYPNGHDLQYVRLWDTAGLGTHEHPSANYFKEKCLHAFDVLMIVTEKELGEYEYAILQNAEKQEIPAVVVITKAEEKVNSKIRITFNTRNPPLTDYAQIVQETTDEARQRIFASLQRKGLKKTPVFIVSAWMYRDFMMEQENLMNIGEQESNPNQEARGNEPLNEEISPEEVNANIVEDESLAKTALLAFEINHLLDYIGGAAVYRRL